VKESKANTHKSTYSIDNGQAIKPALANPGLGKSATESSGQISHHLPISKNLPKSFRLLYYILPLVPFYLLSLI
jgi:hypothetical protein